MGTITSKRCVKTLQKNPCFKNTNGNLRGFEADPAKVAYIKGAIARIYNYPYSFCLHDLATSKFTLVRNGFTSLTKNIFETNTVDSPAYNRRDPKNVGSVFGTKMPRQFAFNSNYAVFTDLATPNRVSKNGSTYTALFGLREFANEPIPLDPKSVLLGNIQSRRRTVAREKAFQAQIEINGSLALSSPSSFEAKIESQSSSLQLAINPNFASTGYIRSDFEYRTYYSRAIDFSSYLLEQNTKYEMNQIKYKNLV
jgi:hypothetical protein